MPVAILNGSTNLTEQETVSTSAPTVNKPSALVNTDYELFFNCTNAGTYATTPSGATQLATDTAFGESWLGQKLITNAAGEPSTNGWTITAAATGRSIAVCARMTGVNQTTFLDHAISALITDSSAGGTVGSAINITGTATGTSPLATAVIYQFASDTTLRTFGTPGGWSLIWQGQTPNTANGTTAAIFTKQLIAAGSWSQVFTLSTGSSAGLRGWGMSVNPAVVTTHGLPPRINNRAALIRAGAF